MFSFASYDASMAANARCNIVRWLYCCCYGTSAMTDETAESDDDFGECLVLPPADFLACFSVWWLTMIWILLLKNY